MIFIVKAEIEIVDYDEKNLKNVIHPVKAKTKQEVSEKIKAFYYSKGYVGRSYYVNDIEVFEQIS